MERKGVKEIGMRRREAEVGDGERGEGGTKQNRK